MPRGYPASARRRGCVPVGSRCDGLDRGSPGATDRAIVLSGPARGRVPPSRSVPARARLARLLFVAVLLAGATLRLVFLDADPDYYAWVGYITDEGRWVAHAREMALFGHLGQGEWLLHLILAPLFQTVAYVAFKLIGVSIWAARLPTALAGGLLLVSFWLLLRRVVSPGALLVGVALCLLGTPGARASVRERPGVTRLRNEPRWAGRRKRSSNEK